MFIWLHCLQNHQLSSGVLLSSKLYQRGIVLISYFPLALCIFSVSFLNRLNIIKSPHLFLIPILYNLTWQKNFVLYCFLSNGRRSFCQKCETVFTVQARPGGRGGCGILIYPIFSPEILLKLPPKCAFHRWVTGLTGVIRNRVASQIFLAMLSMEDACHVWT